MNDECGVHDERITTFGRLLEAHAALTHLLNHELEESIGLPLLWYGVLLLLGRSPGGIRPIGELVNATAFTSSGVTRLVDRMEAAGCVVRRPCPTDRRVQYVGLTDTGREMLGRATAVHVSGIQEHLIGQLTADEVIQLDGILRKLIVPAERSLRRETARAGGTGRE